MARHLFQPDLLFVAGAPVTFNGAALPTGLLAANAAFTMWSDMSGGTDYTADLRAPDGVTPITAIADSNGQRPYLRGPEDVQIMFCDTGSGTRYPVVSFDAVAEVMAAVTQLASSSDSLVDAHLGGDATGLVNIVAAKAVLDPATGLLREDQLPAAAVVSPATNAARGVVRLAGDLAGSADSPTVVGLSGKAADVTVVHKTGAESVGGVKTFTSAPVVPDASFAIAKVSGLQAALDSAGSGGSSLVLNGSVFTNEL